MNRWLRCLLVAVVCVTFALSLVAVNAMGSEASASVREFSKTLVPLTAGVIIGAVGVFLGSLGGLYALIATKEQASGIDLAESVNAIRGTAAEIRHDVLFVLGAAIMVEAGTILRRIDVAGVRWPITSEWLSREMFVDAFLLSVTVLAFIAVVDVVLAMFKIHEQYDVLHPSDDRA